MIGETRVCNRCQVPLPVGDFYLVKATGKPMATCKNCHYARVREWVKANRPRARELAKRHSRKAYRRLSDRLGQIPEACPDCGGKFPSPAWAKDWIRREVVCSNCFQVRKFERMVQNKGGGLNVK